MNCPRCRADNPSGSKFCHSCATPLPPGPEKDPAETTKTYEAPSAISLSGSLFAGRYRVVEELGRGGMGVVYRAVDNQLKEEVALKVIKPEIASDKKALERFSTELKLARKIIHRNVCRLYEIMEHQGVRFISMEYVPGEDLKSFIRRARRLDIGAAVAIAIQVGEGLAEAHRQGVVHRDLKPGNIMIDKEGNAKIMDFGIARSRLEEGITGEGRMVGTPEYISPEQIDGAAADAQSDLYALGVIMFEMVCGTYPFEGDTSQIIAQKIHGKKPPDPKILNPHVPDALAKVILKSLEKNRDKRTKTAEDILAELRRIENDLPTSERIVIKARSGVFSGITRRLMKRKMMMGTLLGLAAVAMAVVLVTRPRGSSPPSSPEALTKPTLAVLFFANRTNDPSLEIWRRGLCTKFITSIRQLSTGLKVISESSIYAHLGKLGLDKGEYSADDLAQVAEMSGATHILTGQLMKVGDNWQIYYDLEDMGPGATTGSAWKEGQQVELDAMVADLAKRVLLDMRIPALGRVRTIGSGSPVANQSYAEARDLELRAKMSRNQADRDLLFTQSFKKFQAAIEADPRFAAAYWGLGDYYGYRFVEAINLEDLNSMKRNYEISYQLDSRLAGANAGLGWARYFDQRLDEAHTFFLAAVELDPDDPEINVNAGSFLCSIGQIESGIRYFSKAIESGETSVSPLGPYYRRARGYMDIGRLAEAEGDARAMIALESRDAPLHLLHARILAKMGKIADAEQAIAQAWDIDPASPDLPYVRTYIDSALGNRDKARPILEKAHKENPLWFSYFLSENYAQLDMADEAIAVIQAGIKGGFSKVFEYLYPYQVLGSGAYENLRTDPRFRWILESQKEKHDAQRERYRELCEIRPER